MAEDPNKKPTGDDNPDPKKGNGDDPKGDNKKGNGSDDKKVDLSNYISKEDYEKALKERDGTISSLTKKINGLESGLKNLFGSDDDDSGDKSTDEIIKDLASEIESLKTERSLSERKAKLSDILDAYRDDDGKELSAQAKGYLKSRIDVSQIEDDTLSTKVTDEISALSQIASVSVTSTNKDRRPDPRGGNSGGGQSATPTANEILKATDK